MIRTIERVAVIIMMTAVSACGGIVFEGFGSPRPMPSSGIINHHIECTTDDQCEEDAICYKHDPSSYIGYCGKIENK